MTYTIEINEDQRLHLVAALEAANLPTDPNNDSLHLLLDMLKEMPAIEKEDPRILHGLCL